jgi:hypothetical protein
MGPPTGWGSCARVGAGGSPEQVGEGGDRPCGSVPWPPGQAGRCRLPPAPRQEGSRPRERETVGRPGRERRDGRGSDGSGGRAAAGRPRDVPASPVPDLAPHPLPRRYAMQRPDRGQGSSESERVVRDRRQGSVRGPGRRMGACRVHLTAYLQSRRPQAAADLVISANRLSAAGSRSYGRLRQPLSVHPHDGCLPLFEDHLHVVGR